MPGVVQALWFKSDAVKATCGLRESSLVARKLYENPVDPKVFTGMSKVTTFKLLRCIVREYLTPGFDFLTAHKFRTKMLIPLKN